MDESRAGAVPSEHAERRDPPEVMTLMEGVDVIRDAVHLATIEAKADYSDERAAALQRIAASLVRIDAAAFGDDIEIIEYVGCKGPFRVGFLGRTFASDAKVAALDRLLQDFADLAREVERISPDRATTATALQSLDVRDALRAGDVTTAFAIASGFPGITAQAFPLVRRT